MRLIDADKATEIARRVFDRWNLAMVGAETNKEINKVFKMQELFKAVMAVVEECPTVDPVKHGYWKDDGDSCSWRCSECNYGVSRWNNTRYCPNCGTTMDGEEK